MRKWIAAHRKMVALVVLVAAWAAVVALWVGFGYPLDRIVFNAALWAVFMVSLLVLPDPAAT